MPLRYFTRARQAVCSAFILAVIIASPPYTTSNAADNSIEAEPTREYEPLPRFDVRSNRPGRVASTDLEHKRSLVSGPGAANAVLRWNDELELPHFLFSYDSALTPPSAEDAVSIAKRFVRDNSALFGTSESQLKSARVSAREHGGGGAFTRLALEQRAHGIKVFDGEMLFIIDGDGRVVSESGSFIPEVERRAPNPVPRLSAVEALERASAACGARLTSPVTTIQDTTASRSRVLFSSDEIDSRSEASLVYYPITRGEIRLAYQVLLYGAPAYIDSYLVLVDARDGELLRRESLTYAFQAARGRVFIGENPLVSERQLVTFGSPSDASPAGWIDGSTTEGNNARVVFNPDLTGGSLISANPSGDFDFPLDLSPAVSPLSQSDASAANLFYWVNYAHDRFYSLGFDESSRNFQLSNLERGGVGSDAVRAETLRGAAVDPSQTTQLVRNNAFFATTVDGTQPLLAMLMWTQFLNGQPVNLDSSYDAGVIIHEYTHGVSTRLAGTDSMTGLRSLQGGGMGEGWSDFFAMSFLDQGAEPITAAHATGDYVTQQPTRGVRSYPYTTDFNLNPLTFGDIAYNTAVHAQGTVWCEILWEMRQALVARYGIEAGRLIAERLVVDGLKLIPLAPLFTDARDAIVLADRTTSGGANLDVIWGAFARRGLGASAMTSLVAPSTGFRVAVSEAYDVPPELSTGLLVINDKPPTPAVIDEPLPIIVVDRDIAGSNSVAVRIVNLRTGQEAPIALAESAPGRFEGSVTLQNGQSGSALAAEPGDGITIRYSNASGQSGVAELVETRTVAARRVIVYEQEFDLNIGDWLYPANGDSSPNYWHVTKRRSSSGPRALLFAKEKPAKAFTPRASRGTATLQAFDAQGLLRPRLEFDWLFSGFGGDPTASSDVVTVSASNIKSSAQEPSLPVTYGFRPGADQAFQAGIIDLRFLENRRASVSFSFAASGADIKRKQFQGFYLDRVRITAVSTK